MKKIYFLLSLVCIGLGSQAQVTLTNAANAPVSGDMHNNAQYDSTTAVPKATGSGMNWNFTSLTLGSFTEAITYTTASSTPAGSLFPTANIAKVRGGNNYEYYNSQAATLSFLGMAEPQNTAAIVFSNSGTWINWPTSFGTNNSDTFSGTEVTPTSTNNWSGTISYTASGSGTVVLPNGHAYNNCLQVKKVINLNVTGSETATMTLVIYDYFAAGRKFPIISTEYQTTKTGTMTAMDFDAYVDVAALPVGVNEAKADNSDFIVYPNPAKNSVNILLPSAALAEKIDLFDATGRLVLTAKNTNYLNTSSLNKGMYIMKVSVGSTTLQKQLIITE